MIERMVESEFIRDYYERGTSEFDELADRVLQKFPKAVPELWSNVGNPYYNAVYNDTVISATFRDMPPYVDLMEARPQVCSRKFLMGKEHIYDKHYLWISPSECGYSLPVGAHPVALGFTVNVYGQPGDEDFSDYECIYFVCENHADVESWYGKPLSAGAALTHYAATFYRSELVRMKTYCYDSTDSPLASWKEFWDFWAERLGSEV